MRRIRDREGKEEITEESDNGGNKMKEKKMSRKKRRKIKKREINKKKNQ